MSFASSPKHSSLRSNHEVTGLRTMQIENYDDPKNHKQYKRFKEIMHDPEMVEKKAGGEAGG